MPSSSAPALVIEQVLQVYLTCFNAAATAAPPYLFSYAQLLQYADMKLPVWRVWTINDLHKPPKDLRDISFAPDWITEALAKKDLCDHFAILFEGEVNKKLQDFGARARWLQYYPVIDFVLATFDSPYQLEMPLHSSLLIQKPDGEHMLFDGSLEQFGWRKETWLQSGKDFFTTRLKQTKDQAWGFATAQDRSDTRAALKYADAGLWEHVRIRMNELFEELDWDELKEMEDGQRTAAVRAQADAKFADVKEAFKDERLREDLRQPDLEEREVDEQDNYLAIE